MQLQLVFPGTQDHATPRTSRPPANPQATDTSAESSTGPREQADSVATMVRPSVVPSKLPCSPDEQARILAALHEVDYARFLDAAEPLLTEDERQVLEACAALPWQGWHHVWKPFLDRITWHWGSLEGGWEPFARIVEQATDMPRGDLRVLTLDLLRPTRALGGRVAFSVQRELATVSQQFPRPVIELMKEYQSRHTFRALAFLEPVFESSRKGARVLRSQVEVRRVKYPPRIDPLVCGFLGDGPFSAMRLPDASAKKSRSRKTAYSRLPDRQLLFLLGHWD